MRVFGSCEHGQGCPWPLQPWGCLPPYWAEGARGDEPELVSSSDRLLICILFSYEPVFKVYNNREEKKTEVTTIFSEPISGQFCCWARGTQPPSKMLTTDQCAQCKGKGPWKNECPQWVSQSLRTRELC